MTVVDVVTRTRLRQESKREAKRAMKYLEAAAKRAREAGDADLADVFANLRLDVAREVLRAGDRCPG